MSTAPQLLFDLPILNVKDNATAMGGLAGASQALLISQLVSCGRPLLIIAKDIKSAEIVYQQLLFFCDASVHIEYFHDNETLPFDTFSPHPDITSSRLRTLWQLQKTSPQITLVALPTLMQQLPPVEFLHQHSFSIATGESLSIEKFTAQLTKAGYRHREQVLEHGEFATRGAIIDIFPMGGSEPYRIELFDDTVETIRNFDPETQRSIDKINHIEMLPAHEFPLDKGSIDTFRARWRAQFSGNPTMAPAYQSVSRGHSASGVENYLPLFFERCATLLEYVSAEVRVVNLESVQAAAEEYWRDITHRYEQLRYDTTRPLLPPTALYLSAIDLFSALKPFQKITLSASTSGHYQYATECLPALSVDHHLKYPAEKLAKYLQDTQGRTLLCVDSQGRAATLVELLLAFNLQPKRYDSWQAFLEDDGALGLCISPIMNGCRLKNHNISIITLDQIFGATPVQRRGKKTNSIDPEMIIQHLTELKIGDPVVHTDHGVGRYLGLKTLTTKDCTAEYIMLSYAGDDKVYIPVTALDKLHRYSGVDAEHAPLQKLGSKSWQRIKKKAHEKIIDVAAQLLDIYSKRQASTGFSYAVDATEYNRFVSQFRYQETEDQARAIEDVLKDMKAPTNMERLICGDVGFGKTEVAMRAAFVAVMQQKQVAILVPTTLLANQHHSSFVERFAHWPIKINCLSRLQTAAQQQDTIKGLQNGSVDIVIGTHKLLSGTVRYQSLGLLIVDEEQRFGVRQKEKIMALKTNIDILTLTATPIPRTLNMALSGTRDFSIIATPPARRLAVKTFIHTYQAQIIREAVIRETHRGGQVFYLFNDVARIGHMQAELKKIVPEASIAVAHGQLNERALENVMNDFYHQKYQILLCSTIIETGIDIPNANTIIIDRADKFGLSQLHQLRGRVGRSHHQAYAYLLIPSEMGITKDAEKRLNAIRELGDLGIGFSLANYDLEIRGAGEYLGEEQSGHMHEIGFALYQELLSQAVEQLKQGQTPDLELRDSKHTEIELSISAHLPEDYVHDVGLRLSLYKALAVCETHQAIMAFKESLIDRFGPLPPAAVNLTDIALLKCATQSMGIKKIETGHTYGYLYFSATPNINVSVMLNMIQKQHQQYQLQGTEKLRFLINSKQPVLAQINVLIDALKVKH